MRGVCQLLVKFYNIIESESQFLSPAAKSELPNIGMQLVGIYSDLATLAKQQGVRMWKLQPKLHLFQHLCEWPWQCLVHGNPRLFTTYCDEDLQGQMAECAESCHAATMSISALFKWLHVCFAD